MALLALSGACSKAQAVKTCPGQFDPDKLSRQDLRTAAIGKIPESGATTREFVSRTIAQRKQWIEKNYESVVDVKVDDGWGVTYTKNQYGDVTFHRRRDYLILTTVETRADCPDPERGTLLIFGTGGLRVPVRFAYQSA